MKLTWRNHDTAKNAWELHLTDGEHYSFVAVLRPRKGGWCVAPLEWEEHPLVDELAKRAWTNRRVAMQDARTAFTIAYIGATDEDKEHLWDGFI